jgi:acyl carrier protein
MQHLDAAASNNENVMHGAEVMITLQALKEAMSRVYIDDSSYDGGCGFDTKFEDIGMDSLQLAELIVELEEALGKELELVADDQLETLGDLCRALRAVGELR